MKDIKNISKLIIYDLEIYTMSRTISDCKQCYKQHNKAINRPFSPSIKTLYFAVYGRVHVLCKYTKPQ